MRSVPSAAYALAGLLLLGLPASVQAAWSSDPTMTVSLCNAPDNAWQPRGATDGAGGAVFAWQDARAGASFADIYAQRVDANGTVLWGPTGAVVDTGASLQQIPHVASDGHGGAYVMWQDVGSNPDHMRLMRLDANGQQAWLAPVTVSTSAYDSRVTPYRTPLVADGSGGVIAVWNDTFGHVYAQRVSEIGTLLWGPTGIELASTFNSGANPTVASDETGGAVIAWEDFRSFATRDIYAQKLDAAGSPQWAANGVAVSTAANGQNDPVIAFDGAGGAIIAWKDARVSCETYAQRIDAAGNPAWTADGIPVGPIAAFCGLEVQGIVPDGFGGAILTWENQQNIRAQRLSAAGASMWNGGSPVAVCTAAGSQIQPGIIEDGGGGAIILWADRRNFALTAVYAQKFDAGGTPQWQADGDTVAFKETATPDIVRAGPGAIIAGFVSQEGGATLQDIHAQKYPVSGTVDVPRAAAVELSLRVIPQPAVGGARLRLSLPRDARVTLALFDASGRRIRTLQDGRLPAGEHALLWDGLDRRGDRAPAGIYFARVTADGLARVTRLVVLGP